MMAAEKACGSQFCQKKIEMTPRCRFFRARQRRNDHDDNMQGQQLQNTGQV